MRPFSATTRGRAAASGSSRSTPSPRGGSALGTYATADGESEYVLRIWSGVEGALRALGRETMTSTMGAPIRFTITRRGEAGPTPVLVVSRSVGQSEWDDALDDSREVFAPPRRRVLRYDAPSQRFR